MSGDYYSTLSGDEYVSDVSIQKLVLHSSLVLSTDVDSLLIMGNDTNPGDYFYGTAWVKVSIGSKLYGENSSSNLANKNVISGVKIPEHEHHALASHSHYPFYGSSSIMGDLGASASLYDLTGSSGDEFIYDPNQGDKNFNPFTAKSGSRLLNRPKLSGDGYRGLSFKISDGWSGETDTQWYHGFDQPGWSVYSSETDTTPKFCNPFQVFNIWKRVL